MAQGWTEHLNRLLDEQKSKNLDRKMAVLQSTTGTEADVDDRRMLMFCGNDYLGYARHPELIRAARDAALEWGVGAGASRLISGNSSLYEKLETAVAAFKHADRAVVFPTGFMTNLGLIASLAGRGDLIISDALNHASLVDACRLSRAEVVIVPHNDAAAYEEAMSRAEGRRTLIVTDGVFSMDGDVAPLDDLADLAEAHDALLVVDDAHGTGVLGPNGRGSLEYMDVDTENVIQMGTFSKALGGLGGFVAGSELVIRFLKNRARTLFYTTGLPPATLAANRRALGLIDEEPEARQTLAANVDRMRKGLAEAGLRLIDGPSAIVPVMIGPADKTLSVAARLKKSGLFCPAMRPPTVPEGQCRLRITVMAIHTFDQIDRAMGIITDACRKEGLI